MFVTLDRNLEFQQNVVALPFGVIVVQARSNRMLHLRPLIPALVQALEQVAPGTLMRIGG